MARPSIARTEASACKGAHERSDERTSELWFDPERYSRLASCSENEGTNKGPRHRSGKRDMVIVGTKIC